MGRRHIRRVGRSKVPPPPREELLAAERRTYPVRTFRRGDRLFVIAFANVYRVAMSNLGFQVVRRIVEATEGWRVERATDAEEFGNPTPRTLESNLPIGQADVLAFAVSTELDGPQFARMLFQAGVPTLAQARGEGDAIVLLGGAAPTVNPEPWALLADLIVVGEAERVLPELLEVLGSSASREARLEASARIEGVYVPSLYEVDEIGDWQVPRSPSSALPCPVAPACAGPLDDLPTATDILTPNTEFSDIRLLEISRGCSRGCRFCVVPATYGRARFRSTASALEVARGAERLGLVGASAADHPELLTMLRALREAGHGVTLSASRIDVLKPEVLEELLLGGQRTITIAPETIDPEIQHAIGKRISPERIREVALSARQIGFKKLKLYFILGLPGSAPTEVDEIGSFIAGLLPECKPMRLIVSAGPLVPKPRTPFERQPFGDLLDLRERLRSLQHRLERMGPRVEPRLASLRASHLETLLSRADRRMGLVFAALAPRPKPALQDVQHSLIAHGVRPETLLGAIPDEVVLPWEGAPRA
jgi:radical SAM superfamily enzyme YgiQ (UPF0313 family)